MSSSTSTQYWFTYDTYNYLYNTLLDADANAAAQFHDLMHDEGNGYYSFDHDSYVNWLNGFFGPGEWEDTGFADWTTLLPGISGQYPGNQ